jgi:hypothetical protein
MTVKCALFGIIFAAFVTPALAANNVEFYVVQSIASHKCSVKELKLSQYPSEFLPTNTGVKLVGTTSYRTLAAAQAAMKADTILYVGESRAAALVVNRLKADSRAAWLA